MTRLSKVVIAVMSASVLLAAGAWATGSSESQATAAGPVHLSITGGINTQIDSLIGGDMNNTPFFKEMEKRTGVHLDWIMSNPEEGLQKIQLLISSRDVPDILPGGFMNSWYPGGLAQAAKDGVIVVLNDYMTKLAPNYNKALQSRPDFLRSVKADDGGIYGFATLHGSKEATVYFGPMIRKDLLDKAGLPVPETIDQWHTALKAFKAAGFATPLTMLLWYEGFSGGFTGAFGVMKGFAPGLDGKVHYGAMEPGYRQYLTTMNQWYQEGLLDPDSLTLADQNVMNTKVLSGKAAALLGWTSSLSLFNTKGKAADPSFEMVPTKYPVLKAGDKPLYDQADPPALLIFFVGGTGKHIEQAIKWYDWGYSPEGQLFHNFGIEGLTYTMKNGVPTFTDEILKNPKGWTLDQAISMYLQLGQYDPTVEDVRSFAQLRLSIPEQQQAVKVWADAQLPSSLQELSFTTDEAASVKKAADVDTYVAEQTARFILGEDPLNDANWSAYVARINSLGIADALAAYNTAYARFQKR